MSIRVLMNEQTPRFVVGRVFSSLEAEQLRSLLLQSEGPTAVEIDFSGTAEIHPVALATLVELAAESGATLRTRGLGVAHRRLLAYLGSRPMATEPTTEEMETA